MPESEVARLRRQIELECQAMERGFRGFAIVARHDFINHRLSQIGKYQEQPEVLVGEDEAHKVVADDRIRYARPSRSVAVLCRCAVNGMRRDARRPCGLLLLLCYQQTLNW